MLQGQAEASKQKERLDVYKANPSESWKESETTHWTITDSKDKERKASTKPRGLSLESPHCANI